MKITFFRQILNFRLSSGTLQFANQNFTTDFQKLFLDPSSRSHRKYFVIFTQLRLAFQQTIIFDTKEEEKVLFH